MTVIYNHEIMEFRDGGTWWLSQTPDVPSVGWDAKYPRTATWVLLRDTRNGKDFYFVNTHLDHKGVDARRIQVADSLMNIACKRYKDVYYIYPNATGKEHETSVDGTHPGDYGYTLWEKSIEKQVLKILKKYGYKGSRR